MKTEIKKKRNIFIVACLLIFAVTIGALCTISVNSINAYADSTNGIVESNILQNNNFSNDDYLIANTANTVIESYSPLKFKSSAAWGYITERHKKSYYDTTKTVTFTARIRAVSGQTVYIGARTYNEQGNSIASLGTRSTNSTTFQNLSISYDLNTLNWSTIYSLGFAYYCNNAESNGLNQYCEVEWAKVEYSTSFTGYVPNSYSNYGYNQGRIAGVEYLANQPINLLYNGELNTKYETENQFGQAVILNNYPNGIEVIPYWGFTGRGTAIVNKKENTNYGYIKMQNYNNQNFRLNLKQTYNGVGINGQNNGLPIIANEKYTFAIRYKNTAGIFYNEMYLKYYKTNGSDNIANWTLVDQQTNDYIDNWNFENDKIMTYTFIGSNADYDKIVFDMTITIGMNTYVDGELEIYNLYLYKGEFDGKIENLYQIANVIPNDYASYWKGNKDGYETGIVAGQEISSTEQYNTGYNNGYNEGEINGYDNGLNFGYAKGKSEGIAIGKAEAEAIYANQGYSWSGLFSAVFNTPINMVFGTPTFDSNGNYEGRQNGLLTWELPLGNQTINLRNFFMAIFSIMFFVIVIKLALKVAK